ncbi:MAG: hypothetical protein ACXVZO_05790 [Gaiellaceae bacterium]
MAGEFDSAWLKWGWASAHAEVLKAEIRERALEFERQGGVKAAPRYDPKHHCVIIIARKIPDLPISASLILGDVIAAYRSSIDHLAWALVRRGITPNLTERQERGVCFPIKDTRIRFNNCLKANLPGARRADIAKVRRYQPYKAGKRYLSLHPLWILAKLSNLDKHRTLQPLFGVPVSVRFQVAEAHDCLPRRFASPGRPKTLEIDGEITRIYVRRTGPDPYVELEGAISIQPFVDEFLFLSDWLPKAGDLIGNLLREFSEPPEGLLDAISPPG